MSDQIRSALSPKFGDDWDRIFGNPNRDEASESFPKLQNPFEPQPEFECKACYEGAKYCIHTSPHREHGGPCERHGCKPI